MFQIYFLTLFTPSVKKCRGIYFFLKINNYISMNFMTIDDFIIKEVKEKKNKKKCCNT